MHPKTIYQKKEGVSIRRLDKDLMLYDKASDKVHILNETGAKLWDLFDGEKTLEKIEHIFRETFPETSAETITEDIKEIALKLETEGLLESVICP